MTIHTRPLSTLTIGDVGIIHSVLPCGDLAGRLADIGCVSGSVIKMLGTAPFGSLCSYEIMDSTFAIRKRDAKSILVSLCERGEDS